jgi:hypothetical protein
MTSSDEAGADPRQGEADLDLLTWTEYDIRLTAEIARQREELQALNSAPAVQPDSGQARESQARESQDRLEALLAARQRYASRRIEDRERFFGSGSW